MPTPQNTPAPPPENELIAARQKKVEDLRAAGQNPYPDADAFRPDATVSSALIATYAGKPAEELEKITTRHRVAGRVMIIRPFGKAAFVVLRDRGGEIQAYIKQDLVGEKTFAAYKTLDMGDFVGIEGTPMRSKSGDFALKVVEGGVGLLAKTVRPLPDKWHGLTEKETRYRQRYADLISNRDVAATFRLRSKIVRSIRNFLDARGFLEVETPMMHPLAGGAAARPFVTKHNALGLELYMRIAPELYLKRLVVGGLDRVYEINRNFRNEGMDLQHNPEFTMLEFYAAYQTYRDLIDLTEEMICSLVREVKAGAPAESTEGLGPDELDYHYDLNDREKVHRLNFAKPWKRVTVHDAVCEAIGATREQLATLDGAVAAYRKTFAGDEEALHKLEEILKHEGGGPGGGSAPREGGPSGARTGDQGPDTAASDARSKEIAGHVVYGIFEEKVEKTLIQPTFVHEFPIAVSPLARRNDRDPSLADRFELFIAGREIANAFSELNDPRDQEARFRAQMDAKAHGDAEAMDYDADYIRALDYGLPPTAGEGIGIDRLVMLLTDQASIRDVILFPLLRPEAR